MKRPVALLLGLVSLALVGYVPSAHAIGAGMCTISGTINFAPSPQTPMQGGWSIEPAVIECHGLFRGSERFLGPGSFTGSGSYTTAPNSTGACLHHVGSGTVDYMIQTSEQDVHIVEPHAFVLAGAGSFTTPTLEGTHQVTPPYDGEGDCLTKPVTKAFFLAQGVMVRFQSPSLSLGAGASSPSTEGVLLVEPRVRSPAARPGPKGSDAATASTQFTRLG